jgi:hypothetical protein
VTDARATARRRRELGAPRQLLHAASTSAGRPPSVGQLGAGDRGGGRVPEPNAAVLVEQDDAVADVRERERRLGAALRLA